jgi:hypothetical protein
LLELNTCWIPEFRPKLPYLVGVIVLTFRQDPLWPVTIPIFWHIRYPCDLWLMNWLGLCGITKFLTRLLSHTAWLAFHSSRAIRLQIWGYHWCCLVQVFVWVRWLRSDLGKRNFAWSSKKLCSFDTIMSCLSSFFILNCNTRATQASTQFLTRTKDKEGYWRDDWRFMLELLPVPYKVFCFIMALCASSPPYNALCTGSSFNKELRILTGSL